MISVNTVVEAPIAFPKVVVEVRAFCVVPFALLATAVNCDALRMPSPAIAAFAPPFAVDVPVI